MTDNERDVLNGLLEHGSLKKAASALGISVNAASQRLYRLRRRYEWAKQLVREYEEYKIRLSGVASKYL